MTMKILYVLLAISALLNVGCMHYAASKSGPVNSQLVIDGTLLNGAKLCTTISIGLEAVDQGTDQFATSDPQYYADVHTWVIKIKDATKMALTDIKLAESGNTQVNWGASVLNIAKVASEADPSTFAVKDPQAQVWFKVASATLQAALITVQNNFGGTK